MRIRRFNNAIHRDLGYFIAGATILYAISGLALNHMDDWNPNFVIHRQKIEVEVPPEKDSIDREWVLAILKPLGKQACYRGHDYPTSKKLKVYLDEGSLLIDLESGQGVHESVKRRPIFYQMNCLHLSPKQAWLVFSDVFAVSLIVVSLTGLFVLRGRKGITGRGAIFVAAGIVVPLVFLFSV